MQLNQLSDNQGATKARTRVGRGIGSGKGKTGGRGVKGQKSRSGVSIKGFEGGQMPLYRRLPKFGFTNFTAKDFVGLGLARIQRAIDAGKLNAKEVITASALEAAGVIKNSRDGVRLLGGDQVKGKLNFEVAGCTATARAAIEAAGGSVSILEKFAKDKAPAKTGKRQQRREAAAAKRASRQS